MIDGGKVFASIKEAQLYRESYTAKLKQLEFDTAIGQVMRIEDPERAWSAESQVVRSAFLSLPAKLAPRFALMTDPNAIKSLFEAELHAAIEVLGIEDRHHHQQVNLAVEIFRRRRKFPTCRVVVA